MLLFLVLDPNIQSAGDNTMKRKPHLTACLFTPQTYIAYSTLPVRFLDIVFVESLAFWEAYVARRAVIC